MKSLALSALLLAAATIHAQTPPATPPKANKSSATKPQPATTTSLPQAQLGIPYSISITGVTGPEIAHFTCKLQAPAGLTLDCPHLILSGTPLTAVAAAPVQIDITDPTHTVTLKYTLTITDGPIAVAATKPAPATTKPKVTAPPPATPSTPVALSDLTLEITSPLKAGQPAISGILHGLPAAAPAPRIQLKLANGTDDPLPVALNSGTTAAQINPDGTFTLQLAAPLPAGAAASFQLLPASGTTITAALSTALHPFTTFATLPVPTITLTSVLRDGVTNITGTISPLPSPAIAANASATPPMTGNLPTIVVLLCDAQTVPTGASTPPCVWYRAQQKLGTSANLVTQQPLTSTDGSFAITLQNPLTSGQQVAIQFFPPQNHLFDDPTQAFAQQTGGPTTVVTSLAITTILIKTQIAPGAITITGSATPSPAGATVNIAMVSDDDYLDTTIIPGTPTPASKATFNTDDRYLPTSRFLPITTTSGVPGTLVATDTTGNFSLTLATPLVEGQRFHLIQILPAHTVTLGQDDLTYTTAILTVPGALDWGRVHVDFAAGLLISNDAGNSATGSTNQGNFSQAHQFYALSVEKAWGLPGCYLRIPPHRAAGPDAAFVRAKCYDPDTNLLTPARRLDHLKPGFSTYFQTRLTAIPVSTLASNNSNTPTTNVLTVPQTARVEVGAYLPYFIGRWEYAHKPNALFFAPLGKVGFDTLTAPSTITTIASGSNITQTQTLERAYNYWGYGARIGHMELTRSTSRAPETFSYLDITIGPYSSLQSYVCDATNKGSNRDSGTSPAGCSTYSLPAGQVFFDSRKRLYRLDIEGLLKIPATPLYVGLNANIGQKTVGAALLDQAFTAPDDIRFFFGTKFDIATLLAKFKLGTN